MKKTYLFTGLGVFALVAALGVSSLTGNAGYWKKSEAVQDALRSGDIEAFRSALIEEGGERLAVRAENIDEERFMQLQTKFLSHEAVQDAIAEGDWDAYQEAVAALEDNDGETRIGRRHGMKMIAETEEEFADLVAQYQEMEQLRLDLTTAVENNDRDAFEATIQEAFENKLEMIEDEEKRERYEVKYEDMSEEMIDLLWERVQEAVENDEELSLRSLKGFGGNRRGFRGMMRRGIINN